MGEITSKVAISNAHHAKFEMNKLEIAWNIGLARFIVQSNNSRAVKLLNAIDSYRSHLLLIAKLPLPHHFSLMEYASPPMDVVDLLAFDAASLHQAAAILESKFGKSPRIVRKPWKNTGMRLELLSEEDANHPSLFSSTEALASKSEPDIKEVQEEEEDENSRVRQVALTVPTTDDPSLPVLTFRMWVLGTISCVLLSFLNQFFWYRTEPLTITAISAQIAVVPLGQLMAANITDRVFFEGTRWGFTLNPGPFNVKEHVFYKKHVTFFVSLIVILTTQEIPSGTICNVVACKSCSSFSPQGSAREGREGQRWGDQNPILPNRLHMQLCILCLPRLPLPNGNFPLLDMLDISQIRACPTTRPLASPWFATANVAVGFILVMYVLTPTCYWLNVYSAKTFPIFSVGLFTSTGEEYNISSIIDPDFHLDVAAYDKQGPLYLSTFFAMTYGAGFAALTATIRDMGAKQSQLRATIFACEYYNDQLQLPWRGVQSACGIAIVFTLPIGIITAITNQTLGLNIVTEYMIGYIYPGYPVANMCFKVYGYISMTQANSFLQDFKLGHYMKIPPRTMFMAQIVGTLIACIMYLGTAWWLMEKIPDICDTTASNSVWTCPSDTVFYDASVIWGLIAPRQIFGDLGVYEAVNWFFLAGAIAPVLVWLASKAFPSQEWIKLINMPVLIGATGMMPPATEVNYTTWIVVGFLSVFVAYRYLPDLWRRYNYVLFGALDAGLAFMGVLLYLCSGLENIIVWIGGE
ncbi:Oligopeptide transporter 7 [Hibiscus syriacus]|uniref:Oligopeptide transporter 7 n=1 Tax=Hibiscus syriacus TaxID=106335 RepID=A0A6A2Y1F8_HIBSY|nr:Oligopeptide transporter 7 [Hibiscus syriacus]